jgi:hypothetical protein
MFYIGIDQKDMIGSLTPEQLLILHQAFAEDKMHLPSTVRGLYELTTERVDRLRSINDLVRRTQEAYELEQDCPF